MERKKAAASPDSGTEPFDEVWCIIDGDYGSKIGNARAKASANTVELGISTPCFEYWVLLHFEESTALAKNCDAVVRLLKDRHVPGYEKGSCDFDPIVKHVRKASARAERLRKLRLESVPLPEKHNPCSEVYKLVTRILVL